MERPQLVGLAFHEARSVDRFGGGKPLQQRSSYMCGVTESKVEDAEHVLGMTYLHSSW